MHRIFRRTAAFLLSGLMLLSPLTATAEEFDLGGDEVLEETDSASAVSAAEALGFEPIPWDVKVSPNKPNQDCYLPDNAGYHDDSIDIQIEVTYWTQDLEQVDAPGDGTTTVMSAHVKLTDVSQFRTGFANKYPSKNARHVNDMTKRFKAVMGINGDYCLYHAQGIVARNGTILRMQPHKGRDELIVDMNGDFHLITKTTQAKWDDYVNNGGTVLHAFCFGPALVVDGVALSDLDEVRLDCGKAKKAQRIIIGQLGPLEYLIITNEGPESTSPPSVGFDLVQMANLCVKFGLDNAYNLDGGSSSTISLNNQKINSPSSHKNRMVGDCIWFATLVPSEE